MARRTRRRNLSSNQKIGIGVAVGLAAVGTATTIVLVRRRGGAAPTGPFTPTGLPLGSGQGTGTPQIPGLARASRRLCANVNALTMTEREILLSQIFLPIMDAAITKAKQKITVATGHAHPTLDDSQIEILKDDVAKAGLQASCHRAKFSDATWQAARQLTDGAWLRHEGLTGQ